jgi:hypothetical protein
MIMVESSQPGDSWSKVDFRLWRKSAMMFESVLAWHNVNQTRPSVSRAAIIDNLGLTIDFATFVLPSLRAQVRLIWLVSLSQVSSMLMIRQSSNSSSNNFWANYWRRTRHLSELAYGWNFLAFTKLIWQSVLRT